MPIALAIARPVQLGSWCGGSVRVIATQPCRDFRRASPVLRVLSRNRPRSRSRPLFPPPRHTVGQATSLLCPPALHRVPIGRGEHDAPARRACPPVAVSRNLRQLRSPSCSVPHIPSKAWSLP